MSGFVPLSDVSVLDPPEDVLTTLHADGRRKWMYPTESRGNLWRKRLVLGWALIVLFVGPPLVKIGGKPAVLLDVAAREFTFFGTTFYPTDTLYLMLFGISALLSVALLTALLGRVWCGWGCPQTVYLEFVFRPIERLIEGNENVRQRRDARKDPTWDRLWRKGLKWAVYLAISVALAHVFVSYFVGWERLVRWMTGPPAEHWGYFVLMGATTALVAFDFGIFREQMCTITCPYARFQSVLMDPDSMIVAYDPGRGEPRGRGKNREAGPDGQPLGDCVDCFACVRTCPTGIDIRDGLQMECVACTQCIDACDHIMDATNQPRGLIRYTSENALEGQPTRIVRPRTAIYGALLVALVTLLGTGLATRGSYDTDIGRAVGAPFMELPDGTVANRLRVRVHNQTPKDATFTVEAVSPSGAQTRLVGRPPVRLAAGQMTRAEAWITVPPEAFSGGTVPTVIRLTFEDGTTEDLPFTLLGPTR
ncbi:cytochrome c oxidase accessory protein CcoG [Rubricoccus marinus]|uniref:cytochrome c oxidase accessory protein CcoG n=1 Tax=Rubricoccus marinus TaxID=716817 RepID=UPI000B992072|nr:cytochrome c oxidase accessory protein CcoG [Rubricoccus marinus]